MTNCGDRTACPRDMADGGPSPWTATVFWRSRAGGRRTSSAAGIITAAARAAMIWRVVLQSVVATSHAANGDMVIGAIPIPAETSETARLRWVSNQPVTQAIIGAKIAAV